jgi:hypothetical protein
MNLAIDFKYSWHMAAGMFTYVAMLVMIAGHQLGPALYFISLI